MSPSPLSRQVQIHKAIGHPARLRILAMLRQGELCVCQITTVLQLAPSTVSAHLAELRGAGLVEERKSGRWVLYRLTPAAEPALTRASEAGLDLDTQIVEDSNLLRRLVELPVEQICRPDFSVTTLLEAARRACCQPAALEEKA
ncbi:MAG TPA: metalloregulator ArsR/SmtB family transcription factor [Thermoanaerobaculaceae bacterium]|nr:metalloregulator ArsR/SmtB family transcription factor [Thermoanaerobaculaceae bacterium]HRS16427.1 metalloregulator ArsR/SmtB family transcription factor [Thermoanaerobaculaceae bacterium]